MAQNLKQYGGMHGVTRPEQKVLWRLNIKMKFKELYISKGLKLKLNFEFFERILRNHQRKIQKLILLPKSKT